MLDYHLHLLRHGEDGPYEERVVRAYAVAAAALGIEEICITEHLFRFREFTGLLGPWWNDDPDAGLAQQTARYWTEHATGELEAYVAAVTGAAADPGDEPAAAVRLGLEVDYYPGRMDRVAGALDGYPFDLLLGSVHWLGAWGFDQLGEPVVEDRRRATAADAMWDAYVVAIEELAATGTCDVLAHPDLAKVAGTVPDGDPGPWWDRLAKAAADNGLAAEVSSAGWRKPAAEAYPSPGLLARFAAAGVPVTTASDAHELSLVGDRVGELRALLADAGYNELVAFDRRQRRPYPLQGS